MSHPSAASPRRYSLHLIAACAIAVVVGGSLLIMERLQQRLAEAERRTWMMQERMSAMKAMMEGREREWKKAQSKTPPKKEATANGVPDARRTENPVRKAP